MKKIIEERLKAVDWFDCCGKKSRLEEIRVPFLAVSSWSEAITWMKDGEWERASLESQNQMTAHLRAKHPNKYGEWNSLVKTYKSIVERIVSGPVKRLVEEHSLTSDLIHNVRWDILGACLCLAYSKQNPPRFDLEVLSIYEAGHLPCGWDGKWPRGRFVLI